MLVKKEVVMAGLDPAIHVFRAAGRKKYVDARVEPAHDDGEYCFRLL
jgi:hypothetical protein